MGFDDVLVLVVFFGLGGSLVLAAVYTASRAYASRSWPEAPGEVVFTQVRIRGHASMSTLWVPEVSYDYWIEGGRYSGNRLRFAVWRLDGERYDAAKARLEPYPLRARISVRYNPDAPGDSVIQTRPDWDSIALCASMGILFLAFGIYMALVITGIIPDWS